MRVCILGSGLSGLALAKALVNEKIYVDLYYSGNIKKINKSRTLGISKSNLDYFNTNITRIEKIIWKLKKIEIYSENYDNKKIIEFNNNKKRLFSVIKNHELKTYLINQLKKNFI